DKNRQIINYNQMPQNLKDATIAIEDKNFYHEGAFSGFGIIRAAFEDISHHGEVEGGSTITQQYVKNALLDPTDHTFTRKIKELILSLEIEQLYNKDDILKLYLNEIPYGSEAYGVEAACRTFFPSDQQGAPTCAQNLTLSQSATLAAMENLPTYYSPYGDNIDELASRQNLVLDEMVKQKMISQKQADAADIPLSTTTTTQLVPILSLSTTPQVVTATGPYPQFALYAEEYLEGKYGANTVQNGGLKVITTLDITKQNMMQQTVSDDPQGIADVRRNGGSNVAMVTADPNTGQVLAMLGSYDPNADPFNVALASRQPGSSFKPFMYATLFSMNKNGCTTPSTTYCPTYGPGSTLYDVKTDFGGGYVPKDYSGTFSGVQSIRTALGNSLNIPAVKGLYIAGIQNSINTAHALGITTLNDPDPEDTYGLSLVLGSGGVKLADMVNGYESFDNGGLHYAATPILKVTDPHNHVLEDNSKPTAKRVLDPQVAYLINNILSDNQAREMEFGLNSPLHIAGRTVAAKTGTTQEYNDAWTMGYSKTLVTGVWVGNNDDSPMDAEAVDIAAPIWHDYMAGFYDPVTKQQVPGILAESGEPTTDTWTAPPGIQTLTLDAYTGGPVTSHTRLKRTDIFPSWYKIPNRCTMTAEIPSTDPSYDNWETGVEPLAARYGYSSSPDSSCTAIGTAAQSSQPSVQLSVTGADTDTLNITATVTSGSAPANQLTIYDNDQAIATPTINGSITYSFSYNPATNGSHVIKAVVSDSSGNTAQNEYTITVANAGTPSGQ
ncbi:MAG TPA: transglycosylase domain-containing protein, partial [Candidatus Saccharimonadales bacterium]|nr:transglycosylase domain-containing protein [Candidatus Saccharimonadales bacterium]